MLHLVKPVRSYDPETVAVMTVAFDAACQSLSPRITDNDDLKQALAALILRNVDRGERDPGRLASTALREFAGLDRPAAG